jgi:hypothetical protein
MRTIKLLALSTLLAATAFVSSGPPWISIEYPGNPFMQDSKDTYLNVHTYHHGTPVPNPISGTAEGIVKGERRTVALKFTSTSRPGVYALSKQWADDGIWTLVIAGTQGQGEYNTAYAIVEIGANGRVASVNVPTVRRGRDMLPAPVQMSEIDSALRERVGRLAAK